mmetsp:Transcript_30773/g.80781  ORF Transcript_30773/g.80781 Transcript_30773/m.80781 type:complete len:239 (+) Transcript_30773:213-929(+)
MSSVSSSLSDVASHRSRAFSAMASAASDAFSRPASKTSAATSSPAIMSHTPSEHITRTPVSSSLSAEPSSGASSLSRKTPGLWEIPTLCSSRSPTARETASPSCSPSRGSPWLALLTRAGVVVEMMLPGKPFSRCLSSTWPGLWSLVTRRTWTSAPDRASTQVESPTQPTSTSRASRRTKQSVSVAPENDRSNPSFLPRSCSASWTKLNTRCMHTSSTSSKEDFSPMSTVSDSAKCAA